MMADQDHLSSKTVELLGLDGRAKVVLAHIRDNFASAFYPRLGEWVCAGMIFAIGRVLSLNEKLMANAKSSAYDFMLVWAPQPTWAYVMMILGFLCLLILLVNGTLRRSPHYRAFAALLRCFFWWQIVRSFYDVFGIAFVFASGILMLDFFNMVRAARDARVVDHKFEQGGQTGGYH